MTRFDFGAIFWEGKSKLIHDVLEMAAQVKHLFGKAFSKQE